MSGTRRRPAKPRWCLMTLRSAIVRAAAWGLAACLATGFGGEVTATHRIPVVPEATRTARGGASAADRSRREDLLRWLRTEVSADHDEIEHDADTALVPAGIATARGDARVPASPDHSPARCRST